MIWLDTYLIYLKRGLSVDESVQAADQAQRAWASRFPERSIDEILRELDDPKLKLSQVVVHDELQPAEDRAKGR